MSLVIFIYSLVREFISMANTCYLFKRFIVSRPLLENQIMDRKHDLSPAMDHLSYDSLHV